MTAYNANGGTISNGAGTAATMTGAVTNPAGTLQIDTTGIVIQTDTSAYGTTSLTQVGNNYYLDGPGGSGPELKFNGAPVTVGQFGSWTPIGAVQTASGYDIAYQLGTSSQYTVWNTDSSGNYISNLIGVVSGSSTTLESFEPIFNQDINGDGVIGIPQTGVTTPAVSSVTTSGTGITAGSGDLTTGGVVTLTVNLNETVTVNTTGGTPTLTLNDGGTATYTGGSGTSALTFSYTVGAGQNTSDLAVTAYNANGGTISNAGTAATMTGAVTNPAGTLQIDTTTPAVSSVTTSGTGISSGSGDLTTGSVVTLTVNMSEAVTVNTTGGTPTLALNDGGVATYSGGSGTGALTFSYTVGAGQNTADLAVTAYNANGGTISNGAGTAATMTGAVTNPAGTLQIDTTGVVVQTNTNVIQTDTSAYGTTSLTQVGNNYFLDGTGGSGPELEFNGAPVTVGQFGSWAPIAAVQTASGYDIAYQFGAASEYTVWNTDSSGNYISNLIGVVSGSSTALESFEPIFNQDINGDGLIGSSTTVIQVTGNILLTLSPLTQAATIAAGASLELAGADTGSVTFQGSTGTLILDHSSTFSGQVIGLTGNGNVSSSDVIDLKDIAFGSATESYAGTSTGGILTVSDALNDTANISLVGNYLNSTFTLSSDGSGGTLVVDPPLSQNSSATSNGSQSVAVDSTSSGATVNSGGTQYDYGTASSTTVDGGGYQIVEAGGVASNTTINNGGNELAFAGGTVSGATVNGGALELEDGALAGNSTIDFTGGGLLKLDGTGTYDMLVAGFASPSQVIDFTGVNFASSKLSFTEASNNTSGTLTVADGTHTASITLLGQYTAASFSSASDGGGGIQIAALPENQQSLLTHPTHA